MPIPEHVWERRFFAHPDCRDPDHPGCDHCSLPLTDDDPEGDSTDAE